jgi:hypothetical protein
MKKLMHYNNELENGIHNELSYRSISSGEMAKHFVPGNYRITDQ